MAHSPTAPQPSPRRSAYAVVAAALVLAVGAGGAGYAAGLVTGADIKDGTITSADVRNGSLAYADLQGSAVQRVRPSAYTTTNSEGTALTEAPVAVVTLTLPPGRYTVSATGNVFLTGEGAGDAQCYVQAKRSLGDGGGATTVPAGSTYATLDTQAVVNLSQRRKVALSCTGSAAGISQVLMTAVQVSTVFVDGVPNS